MTGRAGSRPGSQPGTGNGQTIDRLAATPRQKVHPSAQDRDRIRELAASLRAEVEARAEARRRQQPRPGRRDYQGGPVQWSP